LSIADLYRCRWQVELFFKWIKQHLRIKAFFGTSENAVKTQIWIAISVYVLVAIVKKRLNLPRSLYENLQILSLTLCEQMPLDELLGKRSILDALDYFTGLRFQGSSASNCSRVSAAGNSANRRRRYA